MRPKIVFNQIAELPYKDRFECWATDRSNTVIKASSQGTVNVINIAADHPLEITFLLFGLAVISNIFTIFARDENIREGGEGYGTNVIVRATEMTLTSFFVVGVFMIMFSTLWKHLRGPKRPNYDRFKNFIHHLKQIPVGSSENAREEQRIITHPNPDSPEECQTCVKWHEEFITWLASGGPYRPSDTQPDLEGIWEAVGYILRDIRKHFPFSFTFSEEILGGMEEQEEPLHNRRHNSPHKGEEEESFSLEEKPTEENYDLYNAPLLKTFSLDASSADWREKQLPPSRCSVVHRDIAMRITSNAAQQLFNRSGLLVKEGHPFKAAKILSNLLNNILYDPFAVDDQGHNFRVELIYKSFQLVNLLRPAIHDGQWHNGHYFYAQEPIVTEAFKLLSPQKQAWMIFTLMSGNDHGKLLVLSILQDKRLPLSRLAAFFETYLYEFDPIPEKSAIAAYKSLNEEEPNPTQLQGFLNTIAGQMRSHLLWLTGDLNRLKALFKKDPNIAAKLLLNLTEKLPPRDLYFKASTQHPMLTRAKELFWSIPTAEQQEVILNNLVSLKARAMDESCTSEEIRQQFFTLDLKENIEMIRQSVSQSKTLEVLYFGLISKNRTEQGQAFEVLVALLSDPNRDREFQCAFQELIKNHYDLTEEVYFTAFLNWLGGREGSIDSEVVRARYTAAMLSRIQISGDTLFKKQFLVWKIINTAYPGKDILTQLYCVHSYFLEGIAERCHVFYLILNSKLRENLKTGVQQHLKPEGFQFMSSKKQDLIPIIVKELDVNISRESKGESKVVTWNDLLVTLISTTIQIHEGKERGEVDSMSYLEKIIKRFCEDYIRNKNQSAVLRLNLALGLLIALDTGLNHLSSEKSGLSEQMRSEIFEHMHAIYKAVSKYTKELQGKKEEFDPNDLLVRSEVYERSLWWSRPKGETASTGLVCFSSFKVRIVKYFLDKNPIDDEAREIISNFLGDVFCNTKCRIKPSREDLDVLGQRFHLLVDDELYVSEGEGGQSHRNIVHNVIKAFFSEPEQVAESISEYADSFLKLCQKIKGGFGGLLENMGKDANDLVRSRMTALLLYQVYKSLPPQRFFPSWNHRGNTTDQRKKGITQLEEILKVSGYDLNTRCLSEAFKEIGIEPIYKKILRMVRNHRKIKEDSIQMVWNEDLEEGGENNGGETQPLLPY